MYKFIFIILCSTCCFSQNYSEAFLSVGKPWFPDKAGSNHNNFSVGGHYKNIFSESFGYEVVYEYARSNNLPDFAGSDSDLSEYVLSKTIDEIDITTDWTKIQTNRVGLKMHFLFVNNPKVSVSLFAGTGFLFSSSEILSFSRINYDLETGQILDFDKFHLKNTFNKFYYDLGLQFHYTIYKNYTIGVIPTFIRTLDSDNDDLSELPLHPNYYNLSFLIGYKF